MERSVQIKFNVTDAEAAFLYQKCTESSRSMANYCRLILLDGYQSGTEQAQISSGSQSWMSVEQQEVWRKTGAPEEEIKRRGGPNYRPPR